MQQQHNDSNDGNTLWRREVSLSALNASTKNTLMAQLGIEFVHIGRQTLEATMPVDHRTQQPFGLLHGGASVVLAETLGSVAGSLCIPAGCHVVGTEINASHLRAVCSGTVRGICKPLHIGRRNQVWQIDIFDDQQRHSCTSRLTVAVIPASNR